MKQRRTTMIEHKYYDWNNIITFDDRSNMVRDIKIEVDRGNVIKDQPQHQPNFVAFDRPEFYWNKLSQSFLMSCNDFLGENIPIVGTRSWCFMTSLAYPVQDRNTLWHHHHHDVNYKTLSGVYYLNIPLEHDDCGTEFAPHGPDSDEKIMLPPRQGQWIIYHGYEWHRPGIVKAMDPRFIVAADLIYLKDSVI